MYDLKILFKFGLSHTWEAFKVLPHNFPFHNHTQLEPMTFCMEINSFKKGLKYWLKNPWIYEVIPIEQFVDK